MLRRLSIVLFLACGALTLSVPVRAEDDSAIGDLVNKIKDHLDRMRDSLSGISDDTSQSAVDRIRSAVESARQLRSVAKELADKHPESEPAKTMAERYPDYAERFVSGGEALRELKRLQNNQANTGLTHRCEEAEQKLKEQAQRYVEQKDPEGVQRLPELAEQLGGPLARELEDDERRSSDMSNYKSRARDFSESHERWSDVSARLRDSAEAIYGRWTRTLSDEHRACDELAKQKQHREVVRAIEQLSASGEVRGQLLRELDSTLERIHSKVARLEDKSDDSEISNAVELADTVADILSKLQYAKGKDTKANTIAERWPSYVGEYRESARALKQLKQYQRTLDRAPERCRSNTDELKAALARSTEGSGREAKRLAKQFAEEIQSRMEKADRAKTEIQTLRDNARRFSRDDGKWQDISRAMHASADSIYSYWERALQQAHEAGEDLIKGLGSRVMAKDIPNGMAYNMEDGQMSHCTENEKRPQQDDINTKCKPEGAVGCKELRSPGGCNEMRERANEDRVCIAAREKIIENCFKDNDHRRHSKEIENTVNRRNKCLEKIERECRQ